MTLAISSPSIYPVYCHDLSPTIGTWCPLRAVDVHRLQSVGMILDGKHLYHHGNHPVKWVRVTGVIVAIDEFYQRRVYTVDDSSGECIECTCAIPPPPPQLPISIPMPPNLNQAEIKREPKQEASNKPKPEVAAKEYMKIPEDIDVGSVVKVKGLVTEFRKIKQIDMRSIVLMTGTEEEVKCWNQSLEFRRDILSQPWVVEPAMEEKMRRRSMRPKKGDRRLKDGSIKDLRRQALEPKKTTKESRLGMRSNGAAEVQARKRKEGDDQRLTNGEQMLSRDKQRRILRDERGLKSANKANYPSLAVRNRVAGKYDALGI